MKKWLKIGWVSAAVFATTGYGKQSKEIVTRLIQTGYDVKNIGGIGGMTVWGGKMNYPSRTHIEGGKRVIDTEVPILPVMGQQAGKDVLPLYIKKYKLDLLISLWDVFVIDFLQNLPVPAVAYIPIDAPFTYTMYKCVKDAFRVVAYSKFGYNELLRWFPPSRTAYIPHGIDCETFKPCSQDEKRDVKSEIGIPEDSFLIMFNGANVGERKQIPLLMLVFREFLDKHNDVYLYLFTNPTVAYPTGYDLRGFADQLGIKGHIRFPDLDPIIDPLPDEELRRLYSAADVYATTTIGEGFGLPVMESQACGTPVIGTKCSTMPELVGGHGWLVDTVPDYKFIPVWVPTLQVYPVPSTSSFLRCLEDAYENRDKVDEYGKRARDFALQYDWGIVIKKWYRLLSEIEDELRFLKTLTR